jgi:hypothetical protein
MYDVDAHIAGPRNAYQRIHVGAVHVNQAAGIVHDLANLFYVSFKEAQGVWIGQHEPGDVASGTKLAQVSEIRQALCRGSNRLHRKPGEMS